MAKRSEELYAVLNKKHFTERGILNDDALLSSAMVEVGISASKLEKAMAFLSDASKGKEHVLGKYNKVLKLGIHSIPTLVIDGRLVLSGARHADEVLEMLEGLVSGKHGPITGNSLFEKK